MAVVGVEENQVAGEIRVHQLQGESSCQCRKESPPHYLVWEIVGYLVDNHKRKECQIKIACTNNAVPPLN